MKKTLIALTSLFLMGFTFSNPVQATTLEVDLNVKNVFPGGFVEFKAESDDSHGERATHHITAPGHQVFTWDLGNGNKGNGIWYWWDAITGVADITVKVDGTPVFQGTCSSNNLHETNVTATCPSPTIYKSTGSPKIYKEESNTTYIRP